MNAQRHASAAAETDAAAAPGCHLEASRMPGHWLLARMGKRVLRPGGLELTRTLLDVLDIGPNDDVVEFAPGLGVTARLTLERSPKTYTAVERDDAAAAHVRKLLTGSGRECILGSAESTGLSGEAATVVYGEAMLTMQTAEHKRRIVGEAVRLLKLGGRYGIHELALTPDTLCGDIKDAISRELSERIHVGARPLTIGEWRGLLESQGLEILDCRTGPMHLLEPARLIRDEGFFRALRFVFNVITHREARRRVRAMRGIFRQYAAHMRGAAIVARKPKEESP